MSDRFKKGVKGKYFTVIDSVDNYCYKFNCRKDAEKLYDLVVGLER